MTPRCPKCNALPAYIQEGAYVCMMCGKRWPVNGAAPIVITKITGGKSMTETKKTPSGKKGPCTNCGNVRFIADRAGRCSTCSRVIKGKERGDADYAAAIDAARKIQRRRVPVDTATTTPDRGKTEAIETLPASPENIQKGKAIVREMGERLRAGSFLDKSTPQPSKPEPDMTIADWARIGMARIINIMQAERAMHLAEAEKLTKGIDLLESL